MHFLLRFFTICLTAFLLCTPAFSQSGTGSGIGGAGINGQGSTTTIILGPNVAVGAGIDFSTRQSGMFVLPATSLNFNAPWTVSFGLKATSFLASSNTLFISTNPNTTAGGTGFMLYNAVGAGFTFSGLIRPYNAPTNCTDPPVTCARGTTLLDNAQHWVVWSFDGTNASLYIDNQLKDVFGPAQGYVPSNGVPWELGVGGAGVKLTDMRVRTVASSAADVASLYAYNSQNRTPTSGVWNTSLAAYWPMSVSTIVGNTAQDISGNHNDALFDTTSPTVAVTVPSSGATLSGTSATLTATCTDNFFVSNVTILVDGYPTTALTTSPYTTTFDTTRLLDGSHTIGAQCTDASGNVATASTVPVTSSNSVAGIDYYVSASLGSDSNNGKSTGAPWQTLGKVNAASFHAGDKIHLAGGDTWTCTSGVECLLIGGPGASSGIPANYDGWPSASLTVDNNFNIGNGTACAPLAGTTTGCWNIDASGGSVTLGVLLSNVSGVNLSKGYVKGGAAQVGTFQNAFGIYLRPTNGINMYGNIITAMQVQDFSVGINTVNGTNASLISPTITNNWVHGSSSSTTMDAGILIQASLSPSNAPGLIQGNLVENIGARSTGATGGTTGNAILISNGSTWYTDQMNVTRNSGVNNVLCGGPAGNWTFNGFNVTFQFNESYGMTWTTGCDGDGFDIDGGSQNILYQYNYAHGNKGQGFLTFMASANGAAWQNNTIRYGISESDDTGCLDTTCGAMELTAGVGSTGAVEVYNMTVWNGANANGTSRSSAMSIQTGCPGPGSYIANNLFASVQDHFGVVLHANLNSLAGGCANTLWKNNGWFASTGTTLLWQRVGSGGTNAASLVAWQGLVPGGDTNAKTSNPSFTGTGGAGGTCYSSDVPAGPQSCPSAYQLNVGSPYRSAGIDLTSLFTVGTRDYYANSIPSTGNCYNIGAYGVC